MKLSVCTRIMYIGGLQQGGGNPDPIPGYTTTSKTKKQAHKIRDLTQN